MLLAVGEARIPDFDPSLARLGTAFGGGIAGAKLLCGCVAGAALIFGFIRGRETPDDSRRGAWSRMSRFRRQFGREFGALDCRDITRDEPFLTAHRKCAREVLTRATELVLELLDRA